MTHDGKRPTEIGPARILKACAKPRPLRWIGIALGMAALSFTVTALAQDPAPSKGARPDAGRGETFARHSCSGCHVVGEAIFGTDAAPPFRAIAKDPNEDADRLRGFLVKPHPPMVPLSLSRIEIEDLIAYFQQLRTQP